MRNIGIVILVLAIIGVSTSCKGDLDKASSPTLNLEEVGYYLNFRGIGNEPGWVIEVSNDSIHFSSLFDSIDLSIAFSEKNYILDIAGVAYSGSDDNGNTILVRIIKEKCSDTMSDKEWPFKTEVVIIGYKGETTFSGCGEYIADDRLNSTWVLKELGSKPIGEINGKIPSIRFDVEKFSVEANMGCNGMGGSYELMENSLHFSNNFMSTQMYCQDFMELEDAFKELVIGKTFRYYFEGDMLVFTDFKKTIISTLVRVENPKK